MSPNTVTCNYCGMDIYYDNGMQDGFCIHCGRRLVFDEIQNDSPKLYEITLEYVKGSSFDQSVEIELDGKRDFISRSTPLVVKLPKGKHRLIAQVHVSAGVNSTDIRDSFSFDVDSDATYILRGKLPLLSFSYKLEFYKKEE